MAKKPMDTNLQETSLADEELLFLLNLPLVTYSTFNLVDHALSKLLCY